jgi:hypothetical protein
MDKKILARFIAAVFFFSLVPEAHVAPPASPQWLLLPGAELRSGNALCSKNNLYCLAMELNGNLTFYKRSGGPKKHPILFSSNTAGHPGANAFMQTDGNFVIYKKGSRSALWSSNTAGHPRASAVVQDDGAFVIYDNKGVLWASKNDRTSAILRAANKLAAMHLPYTWGGGHESTPAVPNPGLDCSGAVSWVLQHAGFNIPTVDAGWFSSWGKPVSQRANMDQGVYVYVIPPNVHVFMRINGRVFESAGFPNNETGGPKWTDRTDFSGTIVREVP